MGAMSCQDTSDAFVGAACSLMNDPKRRRMQMCYVRSGAYVGLSTGFKLQSVVIAFSTGRRLMQ